MIYIYPDPKDMERIAWATHKVESAVRFYGKDETPLRMARKAHQDVISAIVNQKYAGRYRPFGTTEGSQRYLKWKIVMGSGEGKHAFWRLWGELLNSITVWKENISGTHYGYMAGIPKGLMSRPGKSWLSTVDNLRGSAKPIAFYARVLEFGGRFGKGGTHPPRPVFTYVLEDFDTGPFTSFLVGKILMGWH